MILFQYGEWWELLSGAQKIFWGISIIFSVLFLIQFVLSLIGLDFDSDTDADFSSDAHIDHGYSLDTDFALFSVRSIIAFFTFFGWTGLMVLNGGGGVLAAVGFATGVGLVAMFLVAYMMYWFSRLTEEGNLDLKDAIFARGEVYLPIPANKNGVGKVHVHLQGSLREMDAVTDGDTLPTGTSVRIVEVIDEEVLLVEKVDALLE